MKPITERQAAARLTGPLPSTSLIICSRNRPQFLLETVESVLQGEEIPTEIVIIDQSRERHSQLATLTNRASEIRYHHVDSAGLSRARNTGIATARYDILAFIDDDMFVSPTWFGAIIRSLLEDGPNNVVTGRVLPTAPDEPGGFAPSTRTTKEAAVFEGRIGRDVLYPNNMAMHRKAVDDVGLFDERLGAGTTFPAAEDNDFGFRLLEAAYLIRYVPQAVVYHRAWRTERDYLRLYWQYSIGQGAYYAKYLSIRDRYMLSRMLSDIVQHIRRIVWGLRGERKRIYKELVRMLGLLFGATKWLLTQRDS